MIKYAVYQGEVLSRTDGDWHRVSYMELIRLHCLKVEECVDATRRDLLLGCDASRLIPVTALRSGDYPVFDKVRKVSEFS